MEDILEQLKTNLLVSQKAQKSAANFHRTPALSYQVGDQVWLNSKNIRTQKLFKKLDNKWIGSFTITELVGKHAGRLELPATLWIHPVFHVFLLRLIAQDPVPGQINQCPGPVVGIDRDDPDIYEIESILDSQTPQGRQGFKYLVKWKGWPHEYNTKEPVKNLTDFQEAIWTFHELYLKKLRLANFIHRFPSLQELV